MGIEEGKRFEMQKESVRFGMEIGILYGRKWY